MRRGSIEKLKWNPDPFPHHSERSWTRADGMFCITTARHGRSKTYTLHATEQGAKALFPTGDSPLNFDSPQAAKEASLLPPKKLLNRMRSVYFRGVAYLASPLPPDQLEQRTLAIMIEDARKEDAWRSWKAARQAA